MPNRALMSLLVLSLAAPAFAQDPPEEPPPPVEIETEDGVEYLVLRVGEEEGMEVKEFIKLAQTIEPNKTYIYNDNDLMNTTVGDKQITWIGAKRIRKDNFFQFFQTILYIKGLAAVIHSENQDTEIFQIVSKTQGQGLSELKSKGLFVTTEEIVDYANHTGVQILTSVPVQHIDATGAQNTLRQFFIQGAAQGGNALQLGVVGRSLLIQGFGPQVYSAYQLLRLVDQEQEKEEHEVRVSKLEHASADELDVILKDILEDRQRRAQATGASGAAMQLPPAGELKIVPHNSLNAIILSGTHDQVIEGQGLIALLDVPADDGGGDTHVVRLKNVLAEDLYDTLNRFIEQDTGAERAQAGQAGAQARQPRRTVVVPHKESNSLLVSGTATKFKQLQKVIDDLDQRQPQVLIECAVIELATTDSARVAIELGLLDIGANEFTRPFGFTSFGLTTLEDQDGDGLPDTRLPDFENISQGFTGGIISSDDFAIPIVLNALAANDRANILSLPSVIVNNNESALVSNQEERPTQEINQGNATTQSGAGTPRSAGITLSISPSISSNNYLRLNVDLTVSRFTTAFDPNAVTAGVIAERQLLTQVTLPSGHTMVLGGVIEDRRNETSSGIPLLKDIPILGWLFQSWSENEEKTNLYFFLTPYILDEEDFSDLAEVSFRKKLDAAEYIGHRRIQLIDRKWREGRPETLEDPGATIEDLDARGGFDIPYYKRPEGGVDSSANPGPRTPDEATGAQEQR